LQGAPPGHGASLLRRFAGQAKHRRSTRRLDGAPLRRECPASKNLEGHSMGWYAILLIALFVASFLALNRYEFGRFD
jgi:hypothetical protein